MRTTPGKYRIRAMPYVRQDDAPEVRSDGAAAAIYGSTYYPSSMRQEDASVVEAVAGHEITGIELRLLKQERGGAISGLVTGIPEGGSGVSVMLQSGTDGDSATGMQGRGIRQDGKFSFHGLQPGNYRIFARYTAANKELQSQMVDIRLDGGDSADVDLMLAPGGELSGSIEPGGVAPAKRTVRLETVGPVFSSSGRTGEVDENGAFRIGNVLPAKYRLHVDPLPENAYVKSLWIDGAVAGALDLSRGARDVKVKIALGPDGGSLSGAVLDHEGDRLVNSGGWVTLMADADDSDPDHRARITPEGKYSFKGIRPGKYRLFAADPFQSRASGGMEESRKFYASAEEIEIKPGARMVQDVKLASKGNAGAKK
jgi:hypothetical protein